MLDINTAAETLAEIFNVDRMVPLVVAVAPNSDTIYIYTHQPDIDIGYVEFYGYLVKTKYIGEVKPA